MAIRDRTSLARVSKRRELAAKGTTVDSIELGKKDKEGVLTLTPNSSAAKDEVFEFLSINKNLPRVDQWAQFSNASDRFCQELGINPLLPEFGQIGGYEPMYKSYKHGGFLYRLDSGGLPRLLSTLRQSA